MMEITLIVMVAAEIAEMNSAEIAWFALQKHVNHQTHQSAMLLAIL
jgi:hypothetical protein